MELLFWGKGCTFFPRACRGTTTRLTPIRFHRREWTGLQRASRHRGSELIYPSTHRGLMYRQWIYQTTIASGRHFGRQHRNPNRKQCHWVCTVDGRQTICTFLGMEQMGHEIILGINILEKLGLQLTINEVTIFYYAGRRKYRLCIDFGRLNLVTEKDAYPLPQVNTILDNLRGATYLSTIDLKTKYW